MLSCYHITQKFQENLKAISFMSPLLSPGYNFQIHAISFLSLIPKLFLAQALLPWEDFLPIPLGKAQASTPLRRPLSPSKLSLWHLQLTFNKVSIILCHNCLCLSFFSLGYNLCGIKGYIFLSLSICKVPGTIIFNKMPCFH